MAARQNSHIYMLQFRVLPVVAEFLTRIHKNGYDTSLTTCKEDTYKINDFISLKIKFGWPFPHKMY